MIEGFFLYMPCVICLICLYWAAVRVNKNRALVLRSVLLIGLFVFIFTDVERLYPSFDSVGWMLSIDILDKYAWLVLPICLYLWLREITGQRPVKKSFHWWWLLPAVAGTLNVLCYCALPANELRLYLNDAFTNANTNTIAHYLEVYSNPAPAVRHVVYYAIMVTFILQCIALIFSCVKGIRYIRKMQVIWPAANYMLQLEWSVIAMASVLAFRALIGYHFFSEHIWVACAIGVYLAVDISYMHHVIDNFGRSVLRFTMRKSVQESMPECYKDLQEHFEHLMLEEGWAYRSDWTKDQLLHEMKTNDTYLSIVAHGCYGMSLSQWIEHQRIAKLKEQVVEHPDWTMSELAKVCGFVNMSRMLFAFKSETGEALMEWRKQHSAE